MRHYGPEVEADVSTPIDQHRVAAAEGGRVDHSVGDSADPRCERRVSIVHDRRFCGLPVLLHRPAAAVGGVDGDCGRRAVAVKQSRVIELDRNASPHEVASARRSSRSIVPRPVSN